MASTTNKLEKFQVTLESSSRKITFPTQISLQYQQPHIFILRQMEAHVEMSSSFSNMFPFSRECCSSSRSPSLLQGFSYYLDSNM